MSAHVLLHLLNQMGIYDILRGLPSILSHFRNECHVFNNNSNTPPLYSQCLNSVIYWLKNHSTYWAWIGVASIDRRLIFKMSSITYVVVTFTIDGATSFYNY